MAYLTYAEYQTYSGDKAVSEGEFNRLSWLAEKECEDATAGVDNISKLHYCTPTDTYSLEAVKRCVTAVINLLNDIETASSLNVTDNGVRPSLVASVHAGNESISYATGGDTALLNATKSQEAKNRLIYSTICDYLKGTIDSNGVNMLYAGTYPYTISTEEE